MKKKKEKRKGRKKEEEDKNDRTILIYQSNYLHYFTFPPDSFVTDSPFERFAQASRRNPLEAALFLFIIPFARPSGGRTSIR